MIIVILTDGHGRTVGSFNAETIEDAHYDAKTAIRSGAAAGYRIL